MRPQSDAGGKSDTHGHQGDHDDSVGDGPARAVQAVLLPQPTRPFVARFPATISEKRRQRLGNEGANLGRGSHPGQLSTAGQNPR